MSWSSIIQANLQNHFKFRILVYANKIHCKKLKGTYPRHLHSWIAASKCLVYIEISRTYEKQHPLQISGDLVQSSHSAIMLCVESMTTSRMSLDVLQSRRWAACGGVEHTRYLPTEPMCQEDTTHKRILCTFKHMGIGWKGNQGRRGEHLATSTHTVLYKDGRSIQSLFAE